MSKQIIIGASQAVDRCAEEFHQEVLKQAQMTYQGVGGTLAADAALALLKQFGPIATHAVFAYLSAQFGPQIQAFLQQYGPRLAALVSASDWQELEQLLHSLLPSSVDPIIPPNIRAVAGGAS